MFLHDNDNQTVDALTCDTDDEIFEINDDPDPVLSPSISEIRPITCPQRRPQRSRPKARLLTTPNFKWRRGSFQPIIHQFDPSVSGINKVEFELGENSPIIDFFESFFTPSLMGKVAFETNRYYKQNIENQVLGNRDKR